MKEKCISKQAMVWLGGATLLTFLTGGDTPVELAVWLSPVFWLRFFWMSRPLKGFLFAFPCMFLAGFLSSMGMSPLPIPVFIFSTIIGAAILLLPYLLERLLATKLPGGIRTLLLPALVVAVFFLLFLVGGFGTWGSPAYSIRDLVWLQLTSVTGVWGLTFLIYWTASVINEVGWMHRSIKENQGLLISFVVILIVIYGYGVLRLQASKPIEHTVRVAGITPTPANRDALLNAATALLSRNHITGSQIREMRVVFDRLFKDLMNRSIKVAQSGVDIVVWSEGAAAILASDEERYLRQARSTAKEHGIYLGLAVVVVMDNNIADLHKNPQPFIKNKLIFILPDGNIAWEHMKATLVPGPEAIITIPGDGILKTVNVPVVPVGSVTGAICYELDFPQLIRQAGRSGSSLLLAPANDWPAIKHMHATMARTRAIENGLAVIRPTSGGISIAVDPYGRIVSQVDYFQSRGGALVALLPVKPVATLYSSFGDLFAWIVLIGTAFLLVGGMIRYKRQGKL
jgi:apolipoprotein N-acyltransferase